MVTMYYFIYYIRFQIVKSYRHFFFCINQFNIEQYQIDCFANECLIPGKWNTRSCMFYV